MCTLDCMNASLVCFDTVSVCARVHSDRFCRNCKNKRTSFGYDRNQNRNQKLCITDYQTVSTWSFCPQLPFGLRIIRDRFIVPFACSCQSIRCEPVPQWRK